jgi:hypothetical protein
VPRASPSPSISAYQLARLTAVAGWLVAVAAVASLAVFAALHNIGAVTSIGLPIAILAFLIQIVVFIAQAWQAQQVTTQTSALLAEVQTSVRSMERSIQEQYTDLFHAYTEAQDRRETASQQPSGAGTDAPTVPTAPLPAAGKSAELETSPENLALLMRFIQWPEDLDERKTLEQRLVGVTPRAVRLLNQHLDAEVNSRLKNFPWIGLWGSKALQPQTDELVERGLLREEPAFANAPNKGGDTGHYYVLTDDGRNVGRLLSATPPTPE